MTLIYLYFYANFYETICQSYFYKFCSLNKNNLVIFRSRNIIKFKPRISILYFTKESHVLKNQIILEYA